MKEIVCSFDRPHSFSELFQLGSMSFQVDVEWAKWPDEFMGIHVMNTCWGDDGFLYAATDRSEAPIVVMDGKGQFVRAIGQGLFQKAHSVFCTAKDTLIVADAGKNSHFIREITPQGQLVRTFGTPGVPGNSGYEFDYFITMEAENRQPTQHPWCTDPKARWPLLPSLCYASLR